MSGIKTENLSFCYDDCSNYALKDVNLEVRRGELVLLAGSSGSGKTTLIRCLKEECRPLGKLEGRISFGTAMNCPLIGYIDQNVDAGLVTDKVWHELAFGLENMGCSQSEIRLRTAEMASYFGLSAVYHKKINELSGGMKQLVSLASVMVMNPEILLLDEPTSRLDPIAADEFIRMLKKIHDELGTTIIISEHRIGDVLPIADKLAVMENGGLILNAEPQEAVGKLYKLNNPICKNMPSCVKVYLGVTTASECNGSNASYDSSISNDSNANKEGNVSNKSNDSIPLSINSCRSWIADYLNNKKANINFEDIQGKTDTYINKNLAGTKCINTAQTLENNDRLSNALEIKNLSFNYEKEKYILHHLNLVVNKGTIHAIVGANGSGKSTLLAVLSGIKKDFTGKVVVMGQTALMNQEPELMFFKDSIGEELNAFNKMYGNICTEDEIKKIVSDCDVETLLERHPMDVSGGELQRAALARVLMTKADILLLDEPTKGMDGVYKEQFTKILLNLKKEGKTIIIVSHDLEYVAQTADKCSLIFDGEIPVTLDVREFFNGNSFYTTDTVRISNGFVSGVLYDYELIEALKGLSSCKPKELNNFDKGEFRSFKADKNGSCDEFKLNSGKKHFFEINEEAETESCEDGNRDICNKDELKVENINSDICNKYETKVRTNKAFNIIMLISIIILIPCTIWFGVTKLNNRKYYFISLLIILEMLLPLFVTYERKKPKLMEMVLTACMCALIVIGRAAFYMTPNFKPCIALVIITGIALGPFDGFVAGALSMLISNMLFMQGPWTPWQMLAMGLVGFIAGFIGKNKHFRQSKAAMCIFGALACFLIYGLIMNPASVIMYQGEITKGMLIASYATGFPMDAVQAAATIIFLFFGAKPILNKLKRVMKYMKYEV